MSLQTIEATATVPALSAADRRVVFKAVSSPAVKVPVSDSRTPPVDPAALAAAVETLNDRYNAQRTDLHFTVDEVSGRTVVAVVDAKDGTVLRQIPSEEALRIAHALANARGALIERVA